MVDKKTIDMLFIHPPANVGNSKPTLDADVAYTDEFVSFPMGFFSMADNLEKSGFNANILNLGERVYDNKTKSLDFLIKDLLEKHIPKIVGLDAHWMIHSAGAIETARLIKKYSPTTDIILGGYTASLFAEEILNKYPFVDFVMKGQCDESIVILVSELSKKSSNLSIVSGLNYREGNVIRSNTPQTPNVRDSLEITRYDLLIDKPTINPDRALITIERGCNNNCNFCTGANDSFKDVMGADKIYIINPERVVSLIRKSYEKGRDKIYVYGDIRRGGKDYVKTFFSELEKQKISDVHILFEFIRLADKEYISQWTTWAKKHNVTLEATHSPDSGDYNVRRQFSHKKYSNNDLLEHCRLVAAAGIPQSVYFLHGLPLETKESANKNLELAEEIIKIYSSHFDRHNLRHDITPICFMQIPDAGSDLFRNPLKYGYTFDFSGFSGLVDMLKNARHWTDAVGFSTSSFTKDELIQTHYQNQKSILNLYFKYGLIDTNILKKEIDKIKNDEAIYYSLKQ